MKIPEDRLTEEKYQCSHCNKQARLVKVRGSAWLCKEYYNDMLAERRVKRRAIREINRIFEQELGA